MSKLKLDNVNYEDSDFIVAIDDKGDVDNNKNFPVEKVENNEADNKENIIHDKEELIINRAKEEAQRIIEEAQKKAQDILSNVNSELEERKTQIIENATKRADEIVAITEDNSKKEKEEFIEKKKIELEEERIKVTKEGYEVGHKDGIQKAQEELEEKISSFDTFFKTQYELKDKILKSANKDILDLIINITRKILFKELNPISLEKIIKSAISLLEKKENVNIILSEKYARMLFELQKKSLDDDIDFKFEDFKQYENFDVIYNPDFEQDTIIIENLKERYDASIASQLDVIIRDIYDNSQNGKLDLEQYENEVE